MNDLVIEPLGEKDFNTCDCCGRSSRTVWGLVNGPDQASYFVHWTLGKVAEFGASVDVVIGAWGDGTGPEDRATVSLEFRQTETGPGFMIVDGRELATLAAKSLARAEVVGTERAKSVFRVVDAVWLQDSRLHELHGAAA